MSKVLRVLYGAVWALFAVCGAANAEVGTNTEFQVALDAMPRDADRIYRLGLRLVDAHGRGAAAKGGSVLRAGSLFKHDSLERLARDPDWRLRRLAALLLGEFPVLMPGKALLTPLLSDPHWRVRQEAMMSLAAAPRPWAERQLLHVLARQDPEYATDRRAAVRLAEAWAFPDAFVVGCRDPDGEVQLRSVWALDLWLHDENEREREFTPAMQAAVQMVVRKGTLESAREAASELLANRAKAHQKRLLPVEERKE